MERGFIKSSMIYADFYKLTIKNPKHLNYPNTSAFDHIKPKDHPVGDE